MRKFAGWIALPSTLPQHEAENQPAFWICAVISYARKRAA